MADKLMSSMTVDSTLDGTERLLAQGADGAVILVSAIAPSSSTTSSLPRLRHPRQVITCLGFGALMRRG